MTEAPVPPSKQALAEANGLCEEVLRNIELGELTLEAIALKTSRIARLMNDVQHQRIFQYEAGGYPSTPTGVQPDVWALLKTAGRTYSIKEKDDTVERAYLTSIAQIEQSISISQHALGAARDPDLSISSANPNQLFFGYPQGNALERQRVRSSLRDDTGRLAARRAFMHSYVTMRFYELKYSGIADDIFSRLRTRVDPAIGEIIPSSVQKFTAVYENLRSENSEDWSNAVHGCRRLLQDLADAVFPAQSDRIIEESGNKRTIKLGSDNYINRIMCFISDRSASSRYAEIVGSHLKYMGERVDSIFHAAQKGSHTVVADRAEAERCVVYTYLLVGDILELAKDRTHPLPSEQATEGLSAG